MSKQSLPLLLLPGNMCDARLWVGNGPAPGLIAMLGDRTVCHADLGRDDTIAAMAARALDVVDGPLIACGFSMGAIVAVEMWCQAPERIAGLVLLGYNASADLPERAAQRPRQQAEARRGDLERLLIEELKPNYLAPGNRSNKALLALLREMGLSLGADVFVRQSKALRRREDRRSTLPLIDVPVLLGCGREDALCPPEWHQRWSESLPEAQLFVIEDAGHMFPLEAPAAFARHLLHWLPSRGFR